MNKHLVVYVRPNNMQEFIDKLDSKGWAVMDIEPSSHICIGTIFVTVLSCLYAAIITLIGIWTDKLLIGSAIAITIALIVSLGFKSTYMYTLICEYVGNDKLIDMTPFDDNDDNFVENENYVK